MKKTILLSVLLTTATSFAQDKDQIEYAVAYIDQICRDIDSNSQLLVEFIYDEQGTKLYIDDMEALSKASFSEDWLPSQFYYFDKTIYLDPECKNITFVHERRGESNVDVEEYEIDIESETLYYIKDKEIIKKIHKTRSYDMGQEPGEWKTEVSYPLSNEGYASFEKSLNQMIENTLIKKELYDNTTDIRYWDKAKKDQIESTVADIDSACRDIDSNSQVLMDFMYDHQWAYLYIDNMKSLSKASISAGEAGYYYEQTIYLDPACKNITFVYESGGEPTDDTPHFVGDNYLEYETWYYIQDKEIIKKIHNTRSYNMDDDPPEWKTSVSYPVSNKGYARFDSDLSRIIEHTVIKQEYFWCDE